MMESLRKACRREDLSRGEAAALMDSMLSGKYADAQMAELLLALRRKGETKEEITGFAQAMRGKALRIFPKAKPLVDTCGTGGDSSNTFNISTTAAFIAAGAGVAIAKHGNGSVSSACGSATVLGELGVKLTGPQETARCIDGIGIGFMFAPAFHPGMRHVMDVRRELGVRTVFNILGPLANPACAEAQLIGVFDPVLTEVMAEALCELGTTRAMAVHSQGMDEIGLGRTKISELASGSLRTYFIEGSDFGFSAQHIPRVRSPTESAAIVIDVLRGVKGAARDIALINAAAAIYLGGKAENLEEGLVLAGNSVDSGGALTKLEALKGVSG